jgi:hypothetical protein
LTQSIDAIYQSTTTQASAPSQQQVFVPKRPDSTRVPVTPNTIVLNSLKELDQKYRRAVLSTKEMDFVLV